MKKCNRYLDALEQNLPEDSARWQDILMHANRCPDCSSDIKFHTEMLEKLAETPPPLYPAALHENIMQAVANNSSETASESSDEGLLAWLLDRFLQPLELAVPAACLLMFIFLIQINHEPEKGSAAVQAYAARAKTQSVRIAELPPADPDSLEHVSGAEVKEFLARLEEFNRAHPQGPGSENAALPSVELVNDNTNLWREP